jgi:hypothetical protein
MAYTIFFSWQSDHSPNEGRNLIESAIKSAIQRLGTDAEIVESLRDGLSLDKDTKGVPGNPPIFDTILKKIDRSAIFVPDLTSVANRSNGELIPNPNVLIEYGWALKSRGYHQIVPVMNVAHGDPEKFPLPFDMAHLRRPILYSLSDGSSEADRRTIRDELARTLEGAFRTILESDEFRSHLPKPVAPPPFPEKQPLNGRARFRAAGKALGITNEGLIERIENRAPTAIKLVDGPAYWLRVIPPALPKQKLSVQNLKQTAIELAVVPLVRMTQTVGFVRGEDGGGFYPVQGADTTNSVAYICNTGEIWVIDAWLSQIPQYVELEERIFSATLQQCANLLSRLGIDGPYRWIAGMEGILNRRLVVADRPYPRLGTCVVDRIEKDGTYEIGQDPALVLTPFFEEIFDSSGAVRPQVTCPS